MARPKKIIDPIVETDQIAEETKEQASPAGYVVINKFVDKDNFSVVYNEGDEVPERFDSERIGNLLKLGLIKAK